jgi:hypothetical protein
LIQTVSSTSAGHSAHARFAFLAIAPIITDDAYLPKSD